jgi:hypothetical protein
MNIYSKFNPSVGFYVYAYIRSKNSNTGPAGTPYYIGKGINDRATKNHRHIPVPDQRYIIICEQNLSEIGALAIERRLIRFWGRKNLKTGLLLNRTDGGEGCTGRSKESRKLTSDANRKRKGMPLSERRQRAMKELHAKTKGKKQSADHINKRKLNGLKNGMFGKTHTDDVKQYLSDLFKGRIVSDETRKKLSETTKGKTKRKLLCPHCQREIAGEANAKRWHFDNCKLLPFKSKI